APEVKGGKEKAKKPSPPPDEKKTDPAPPKIPEGRGEESNKKLNKSPIAPQIPDNLPVTLPDNATVDDLREALKKKDPDLREQAAGKLAKLGPKAEPALSDLAEILTDAKNPIRIRTIAAFAISETRAKAKPVVPTIAKALERSQPPEVRDAT